MSEDADIEPVLRAAEDYPAALDASKQKGLTLDQWADLDAMAAVALRDLRRSLVVARRTSPRPVAVSVTVSTPLNLGI